MKERERKKERKKFKTRKEYSVPDGNRSPKCPGVRIEQTLGI